jgi:uncharacterized protein
VAWPHLAHGILRARYRTSFTPPELLEPGAMYEIRCGPRRVFLPDHRMRLGVSSSNFPWFDRNSNMGEEIAGEAAFNTDRRSIASSMTRRMT